MRTENSLKNAFWTALVFGVSLILNFIVRKIFIDVLGVEYNGLNTLFTSVLSILSIAELGIGTTIIYFLYKPLHHKEYKLVGSLLDYYKRCYRKIAIVILLFGLVLVPFLPAMVGEVDLDINIYVVYILFLLNSIFSYLLSYKRSIIIADQKERVIKCIHLVMLLLLNGLQILILYLMKDYYLFLLIQILFTCAENLLLSYFANKKYLFIRQSSEELPVNVKVDLNKRIKAMFFHQIGGFVVNGTDNIMISMMFGITEVGMYNNYFLIVSSILNLVGNVFSGITASIGNLLVVKNKKESLDVYRGIQGINYIMAAYTSCTFYVCAKPLITLWLGDEYLMSNLVVAVLSFYLYLRIMKQTTAAFKNAAGIFCEDRFVPVIESMVNIVASLVCASIFGVSGIIMGTIISTLVLYFGSYPFIVYRKIFDVSPVLYFKQHLSYLFLGFATSVLIIFGTNLVVLETPLLELVKNLLFSTIIFSISFIIMLYNDRNFSWIILKISNEIFKRKRK